MDSWKKYERHPISAKYSDIRNGNYDHFLDGIIRHHERVEVTLYEGKVLEGWQRFRACCEAGVKPTFIEFKGTYEEADHWAYMMNVNRRHDTPEVIARQREEMTERIVEKRKGGASLREIAKQENVSKDTVSRVLEAATVSGETVEPPNSKIIGLDGREITVPASTTIYCPACARKLRLKQDLPKKCADCAALRKPLKDDAPKKSDADETLKDKCGHVVPTNCADAFATVKKFEEMDGHCRKLQTLIDEVSRLDGGEQLARCLQAKGGEDKTVNHSEDLDALKRNLKGTRPYSICPWCKGKRATGCKGCSGYGWVTKITWDAAEEDVKARI